MKFFFLINKTKANEKADNSGNTDSEWRRWWLELIAPSQSLKTNCSKQKPKDHEKADNSGNTDSEWRWWWLELSYLRV